MVSPLLRRSAARRWCVVASIGLLATGCASNRANLFSDEEPERTHVELTIRNQSPRVRDVYAYWDNGTRDWLGMVPAETTTTFTVVYRSGGIRFAGAPRVFMAIYPGDRIEMVYPRAGAILPPRRIR